MEMVFSEEKCTIATHSTQLAMLRRASGSHHGRNRVVSTHERAVL
jgi:hypothetical protein